MRKIAVRNYISQISFNKIVIIATHVVSDIEYIAGNIIILKKGEIHRVAPPSAVNTVPTLEDYYLYVFGEEQRTEKI